MGNDGFMLVDLIVVPPDGPTIETVVDRSRDRSWTVDVAPFEIATTVVTTEQWNAVHGRRAPTEETDLPRVEVSWREAIDFCNAASVADGLTPVYTVTEVAVREPVTRWRPHDEPAPDDWQVEWSRAANGYRLPTEAEWQVACRAGTTGPRYGDLDDIAWYDGTAEAGPMPTGLKRANAWGLFDTLGGVWEWCWDPYDEAVYGPYRVIKGGGWSDPHWSCRAGVRRKTHPGARFDDLGFRLARNLSESPS